MNNEDEMKLANYLGEHVAKLLDSEPFAGWKVARSIENDLPAKEIRYVFTDRGVELLCGDDERIQTIFLTVGVDEDLSEMPFSMKRASVLERFGTPSKSGAAMRHPLMGPLGAWDRFTWPRMTLHIQYRLDSDSIDRITLMSPDAVP